MSEQPDKNVDRETGDESVQRTVLISLLKSNVGNLTMVIVIFVVSLWVGHQYPGVVNSSILDRYADMEKELAGNHIWGVAAYFGQVLFSLYFNFVLGVFAAIPPVFVVLATGLYTGAFSATHGDPGGANPFMLGAPDIFEAFAMCVAAAWGAKLGMAWFHKDRFLRLKIVFNEGHTIFLKLVIPTLVVAFLLRLTLSK